MEWCFFVGTIKRCDYMKKKKPACECYEILIENVAAETGVSKANIRKIATIIAKTYGEDLSIVDLAEAPAFENDLIKIIKLAK